MARSTRPVILTKNIYTLWDQKRFILQVSYFPKTLEYPYPVRVRGIELIVTMLEKQMSPLCFTSKGYRNNSNDA